MGSRGAGSGRMAAGKNSISGKPFNANDYTTWQVGQEVLMRNEADVGFMDGRIRRGANAGYSEGVVKEVHADHLIIDVPNVSDHMWLEDFNADMFKAKPKKRK